MTVKHAFTSSKPDGADATLVRPSNWNADHLGTNDHGHTAAGDGGSLALAGGYAPLSSGLLVPVGYLGTGAVGTGTKALFDDGTWKVPAASGSPLTVEEVDGTPTDSAVTKIVFPNGTLGIAAHVATYTPSGGGSPNLDGGLAGATYGGVTAIDAGGA